MSCFFHPQLLFEDEIVTAPGSGKAFLVAQLVKNLPAMRESWVRSLGWDKSPGEGNGYLLQYSGLENSMDWIVHGVAKSQKRLSDFSLNASRNS